jgi:hypothetical protein
MLFDAHCHGFRVLGGIPERGDVLRGEETQTYVVQVQQGDAADRTAWMRRGGSRPRRCSRRTVFR